MRMETRPWGYFVTWIEREDFWLKELVIDPGQSLSLQYHENRDEEWFTRDKNVRAIIRTGEFEMIPGRWYKVPRFYHHRLYNAGQTPAVVVEWATGSPDEQDIVRIADNYGR